MFDRSRRAHDFAITLALALAISACSPSTPSAAPSPTATAAASAPIATPAGPSPEATQLSADQQFAAIRTQVEQIRGLQPTGNVEPVTIDVAQLTTNLAAEFDADTTPIDLRNANDELGTLGLIPKGSSLRDLTLALESGQVAGYYSPDKKQLFVVSRSGGLGGAELSTYAHEFTHQLQDQNLDLGKLDLNASGQSDRSLGRLALVEGDAVSVQSTWMNEYLTPKQLGEVMQAGLDPAALSAFNNAPRYLRETSIFPYNDGFTFVGGLIGSGGYDAVNAAFKNPPVSTEQVLHPAKYVSNELPVTVTIPKGIAATMGTGWSIATEDTLGELILRIWLEQGGSNVAAAAAAGWGGDRLVLLRGPGGAVALGLKTEWDTPTDASEFATAAASAATTMGLGATFSVGTTTVSMAIGPESATLLAALGK